MRPILYTFLFCSCIVLNAQKKTSQPPSESPIAAKTKELKSFQGFIPFFYDDKQDKIFLLIDKFNTEFLYVHSLPAGIGSNDIGMDRGRLGGERVVKFDKRGPKVLLTEINYRFRAVTPSAAERKAVEDSFAQSVLFGFKVEAEDNGQALVDATEFFQQDAMDVIGTLRAMQQGNYNLDKTRSAFYLERTKNFLDNSEFEVTLTFTGQPTGEFIRSVTPTPSSVTVRQHHSFIKLPDDNYKPRKFDPRAGYFSFSYYDYATPISETLEKRFITRHRLEKKDPAAAVSEPVKPIIYYLDRGTPEPIRSALLDGARWWNQAFEAAGYRNAFQVEVMPEDADPMDVRYNVIQWVHRSTRGWSYGSSITDPRTGEIMKGHVTLGSLRVRQDFMIAEGLLAPYEDGKPVSKEMEEMALARLRQLSAHEVGHTLGLAHSYASSSENLASVMDYPHPRISFDNGKVSLANAYDNKIGPWDKVAIAFGYQDFPDGVNEDGSLNTIIQNSLKQRLTFLSDQDARPAGGSHPFAHLWDNGRDAADELKRMIGIRKHVLTTFGERNIKSGEPMATIEEVLVPMYFLHRYQLEATSKLIGGLNYRYALKGDGQPVTEFVPAESQNKAIDALVETLSPEFLMLPESLLKNIPPRPLGYTRSRELIKLRTDLTFDALGAAETASELAFSLLFHPARATRMVEFHARDQQQPSLDRLIDKVVNATILSKPRNGYAAAVQMTVNDVLLTNLFQMSMSNSSSVVKATAYAKLEELVTKLKLLTASEKQPEWKSHFVYLLRSIDQFKDHPDDYKLPAILPAPPGQPIGQLCEN